MTSAPQETPIYKALGRWDGIFLYMPPSFLHEKKPDILKVYRAFICVVHNPDNYGIAFVMRLVSKMLILLPSKMH